MEERQHAHDFVVAGKRKYLRHLPDIGQHVVVRQHYAFGIAGAAAGKNNGRQIIGGAFLCAHGPL